MMFGRRHFFAIAAAPLLAQERSGGPQKFMPVWESLRRHRIPQWYEDAKLGIFIHWGLYSVPAWAPPTGELGKVDPSKWFYQNPYAEWYLNSLRLKESPTAKHHAEKYGANFDYYQFGKTFEEQNRKWNAASWASLFNETGARYVVLTTKHHDGYTLWPSKVANPKRPQGGINSPRDLVGDLTSAVRAAGLKMGLYYSGGLDWTFETRPIAAGRDLRATIPQTEQYARYADAHWRELMKLYQPSILWNDIGYPKLAGVEQLFADFYNSTPDGLVNNRFSVDWADITTPEYAQYDRITEKKWESCRGLGFSFGYNQVEGPEHVLAPDKLINLLIDITSKNGNLLLNIGPRADGSISDIQMDRLKALGRWMSVNGEGIHGTRPWVRPSAKTPDGIDVRFTKKGDSVYAFLLQRPKGSSITIRGVLGSEGMKVRVLGASADSTWTQQGRDLAVNLTSPLPGEQALALRLSPAPWQVVKE